MEKFDIIDLIEQKAIEKKCIFVALYSQGYCEPANYDEVCCFISTTNTQEIIEHIVGFLTTMTKNFEFEFDEEFFENTGQFKIDGYKNVVIKNFNPNYKVDFAHIEKPLYLHLIKNKFKTNYDLDI